ncbi:MAG: ribosome maturation factor RimM, partial [Actinobacteria bacterium]|nr:ribosome maturation factor RimM [Actinomycetota bacterium]
MTLLEVGRVGRAHGLRGDVQVVLISDRTDRLDPGTSLIADSGDLRVRSSRPHGRGWLVHFEGVETREAAEALRGSVLRFEVVEGDTGADEELWVHEVIGLAVEDSA